MTQQITRRPSWWTAGSITLIFSLLSSAITAGIGFGKLTSDLSVAVEKIEELKKTNEQLSGYINDWREANTKLQAQLNLAKLKAQALENDRCERIRQRVDSLSDMLDSAQRGRDSEERLQLLRDQTMEYQQSLRACYISNG